MDIKQHTPEQLIDQRKIKRFPLFSAYENNRGLIPKSMEKMKGLIFLSLCLKLESVVNHSLAMIQIHRPVSHVWSYDLWEWMQGVLESKTMELQTWDIEKMIKQDPTNVFLSCPGALFWPVLWWGKHFYLASLRK